jgi:hypothetical protein
MDLRVSPASAVTNRVSSPSRGLHWQHPAHEGTEGLLLLLFLFPRLACTALLLLCPHFALSAQLSRTIVPQLQ